LLSGNVAEVVVLLIGLAFKDRNGQSVFPLSPVAALWINTPSEFQRIFTLEFYADLTFYGFLIGALSLVNFVIVLWGYYPVCLSPCSLEFC
jgi:Na+-exporting ATPase